MTSFLPSPPVNSVENRPNGSGIASADGGRSTAVSLAGRDIADSSPRRTIGC